MQEWTALQNLPSLPRDVTALGAEDLAPSAPTPSRPARAAPRDFDFEYDDDGGGAGTSPRGTGADQALYGGMDSRTDERGPEYLDLDAAALEEARARGDARDRDGDDAHHPREGDAGRGLRAREG